MTARSRRLLALMVLLVGSGAATAKSIPELVADLGHKDYRVKLEARTALIALKSAAVIGPIATALPGFDVNSRTYALVVLEALPPGKTRGLFRSLLRSGDPDLRALGAAGLFRKGDPAGIRVLARDIRNVRLTDAATTRVLVRSYLLRHPDLAAAVRDRLRSPAPVGVLAYLMRAVSYAGDRKAIPVLLPMTAAGDIEVRLRAHALLFRLGHTEHVEGLTGDLADPSGSYSALSDALNWLQVGPGRPDSIPRALVARLEAGDDGLSAARILGMLTTWRYLPAIAAAARLVGDPDARVARAAFTLISKLAGRSQLGALRRSLEKGENAIRILAAEALRRFDDESGLPVVLEVLGDGLVTERRDAARILGGFRRRESVPPLIAAFADGEQMVATYALMSLQKIATALFPYRRFDWKTIGATGASPVEARRKAAALLRTWWASIPKE